MIGTPLRDIPRKIQSLHTELAPMTSSDDRPAVRSLQAKGPTTPEVLTRV